jgi:type IV pilus assembly protein PilZ
MMTKLQSIFSLVIQDEAVLHRSYMPFLKNGGLFIAGNRGLQIGDSVFLLLQLIDRAERIPIAAKVVWVTFPGALGNRTPGIGVQFEEPEGEAKTQIEYLLAAGLDTATSTF